MLKEKKTHKRQLFESILFVCFCFHSCFIHNSYSVSILNGRERQALGSIDRFRSQLYINARLNTNYVVSAMRIHMYVQCYTLNSISMGHGSLCALSHTPYDIRSIYIPSCSLMVSVLSVCRRNVPHLVLRMCLTNGPPKILR